MSINIGRNIDTSDKTLQTAQTELGRIASISTTGADSIVAQQQAQAVALKLKTQQTGAQKTADTNESAAARKEEPLWSSQ